MYRYTLEEIYTGGKGWQPWYKHYKDSTPCHTDISADVQLYRRDRPGLAHPDGGGGSRRSEEEFKTKVSDLIEKWEEEGGVGGSWRWRREILISPGGPVRSFS